MLRNHGYTNPIMPGVVRFYWDGVGGWCSGTLLRRGIVLTAAHCLYVNANEPYGQNNAINFFVQDYGELKVAPGNYVNQNGQTVYPYGVWRVARSWVPTGWQRNDDGLDWGIVEIAPDANGNYPGDYTGTYAAYWNSYLPPGHTRLYSVGYPASNAFNTPQRYYGNGQYFCDTQWDGSNANDYMAAHGWSSWAIAYEPCPMNGGSSGGPVFAQFGDGSWGIVGVNNKGTGNSLGFGQQAITFWLDNNFGAFWNAVMGTGTARAANRTAASSKTGLE